MFCSQCGNKLTEEAVFCGKCGASVAGTESNVKSVANNDGYSSEHVRSIYAHYKRRALFLLFGPPSGLFLIVVLWGMFEVLGEVFEDGILQEIITLFNLLIPIIIALLILAMMVGLVVSIVYFFKMRNIKKVLDSK